LVDSPTNDRGPSPIFRAFKVSSIGLEMALATAIGCSIGYALDWKLGTSPWLLLVFLLLGVAAGFKGLIRTAREIQRDSAREDVAPRSSSASSSSLPRR
jgi:ATP synthase protein I